MFGEGFVCEKTEVCCVVDSLGYLFIDLFELGVMAIVPINAKINSIPVFLQL